MGTLSVRRLRDLEPDSADLHWNRFDFRAVHIEFPDRCSSWFTPDLRKAKLLVVRFRQLVTLSGKILTSQLVDTSALAARKQLPAAPYSLRVFPVPDSSSARCRTPNRLGRSVYRSRH